MRGQISLEYLVIVGVTLALVLSVTLFYFSFSQERQARIAAEQINEIGNRMVSTAKKTYSLGHAARETVVVNLPDSVRRVYVPPGTPTELVIEYDTFQGMSEAVFFSSVVLVPPYPDGNVTNALTGNVEVQFNSLGTNVSVMVAGEN